MGETRLRDRGHRGHRLLDRLCSLVALVKRETKACLAVALLYSLGGLALVLVSLCLALGIGLAASLTGDL